ncbi:MAG: acyltransferase [Microbispora sp.]|nr:acyltransferase [Microbispora sp.]
MESSTRRVAGPNAVASREDRRLPGLDGIRGLAALFVVLHHCWLMAFPGFPRGGGPWWLGWLRYGHLAVVVFIVLSGFSLAVSPARNQWRLGGPGRFARRRAWRILPPYWAALAFSLAVAWTLTPQPGEGPPTAKSVLLYGLLLQDVAGSPSPNGAFWSIAVEAHLYLVFPLMLLVLRRAGAVVTLAVVTIPVAVIGVLAPSVPMVDLLMRFTPQFAVLFALGIVGAGVAAGASRTSAAPWSAAAAALPVVALIVAAGPVWTVEHYFWVDIAAGPAVVLLLVSVATGRPAPLVRLLDSRPLRALGLFSYSLYLIHAPIVVALSTLVVAPLAGHGLTAFLVTVLSAVPLSLLTARLFAAVFELPFLRHRSWAALRAAASARFTTRFTRGAVRP